MISLELSSSSSYTKKRINSPESPHSLVDLLPCRDVELVKGEDDSLQVLTVLHPVDEVSAHDMRLKRKV